MTAQKSHLLPHRPPVVVDARESHVVAMQHGEQHYDVRVSDLCFAEQSISLITLLIEPDKREAQQSEQSTSRP